MNKIKSPERSGDFDISGGDFLLPREEESYHNGGFSVLEKGEDI